MLIYLIILIFLNFKIFFLSCIEDKNNCSRCNPITKLCLKCSKNIYTPDNKGGCEFKKIC